jgi:catechol 2,3-dioxygenase-like lactoylglutathione lyase family enzyme
MLGTSSMLSGGNAMGELRFEGRTVFCADVSASARYYEDVLGLSRASEFGGDIAMTVPVGAGPDTHITLYLHAATAPTPVDLGYFSVPDVDTFIERYRATGHIVAGEPADTPWGTREAVINDLDGNGLLVTGRG